MNEEFVDAIVKKALVKHSERCLLDLGEHVARLAEYPDEGTQNYYAPRAAKAVKYYLSLQELLRDDKARQKHLKGILEELK